MYLYGASGHAKAIIDILKANSMIIDGLYDDNSEVDGLLEFPVFRPVVVMGPLIISIGDNRIRYRIAQGL